MKTKYTNILVYALAVTLCGTQYCYSRTWRFRENDKTIEAEFVKLQEGGGVAIVRLTNGPDKGKSFGLFLNSLSSEDRKWLADTLKKRLAKDDPNVYKQFLEQARARQNKSKSDQTVASSTAERSAEDKEDIVNIIRGEIKKQQTLEADELGSFLNFMEESRMNNQNPDVPKQMELVVSKQRPIINDSKLQEMARKQILALASEGFRSRKDAEIKLEKLGPAIIPILQKDLDNNEPEVRTRVKVLIERLHKQLEFTIPDIKLTLIPIKPGSFLMGSKDSSEEGKYCFESVPLHKVTISNQFWMGKAEVTQAQYLAIISEKPLFFRDYGDNSPITSITWYEADEFCKQLTIREKKAGRLPEGRIFRLPTEAEWEYCCRAGSSTPYSFGKDKSRITEYAWIDRNSGNRCQPVAQKKPNAWGLYDMHGNVWELCYDKYARYPEEELIDPAGPATGNDCIFRGGSWYGDSEPCLSANRNHGSPTERHFHLGFRIVCATPIKKRGM